MLSEQISLIFLWISITTFLAAFILFLGRYISKKRQNMMPNYVLAGGLGLLTISLVLRFISEGTLLSSTTYELFGLMAWVIVLQAFIIEKWSGVRILGVYVSPLAAVLLIISWTQYQTTDKFESILKNTWVTMHSTLIFLAYGAFTVAAAAAFFYLLEERVLKAKRQSALFKYFPSINTLDATSYHAALTGFVLFSVAISLGVMGAVKYWSDGWDPYIIAFSCLTWIIFLFYLVGRATLGFVGKKASYVALAGFASIFLIRLAVTILTTVHIYLRR
ncbi:MAG: hypothetical protein C4562_05990 [Actinobacteria bacterium]|nr:MAG: hypothetical protein C4562_05990 [Actinomycetota bacterium]